MKTTLTIQVKIALFFTFFCFMSYGQTITTLWSYNLPDKVDRTNPAVADDGTIYIACNLAVRTNAVPPALPSPNFFAVNPTGTLKWQTSIVEGTLLNKPDAILSSPSIQSDGSIYMGGQFGRRVFRLNATTGDTIRTRYINTRMRYTAPIFATNGDVFVAGYNNNDKAVRKLTFDLLTQTWIFGVGFDFNCTPAVGSDGTIFAASSNGNMYAINPDGTQKWSIAYGNFVSSAIAIGPDGTVYLSAKLNAEGDGVLKAYLPQTGVEKWSVTLTGSNAEQGGPAVASSGTVYLGSVGGRMRAYNPVDGSVIWSYPLESNPAIGPIEVVPAIDNAGKIYFGDTLGMFYVLNSDGTQAYTPLNLGDRINSSVAIGADGRIFVGASDGNVGKLYALQTTATGLQTGGWPMYANNSKHTGNINLVSLSTPEFELNDLKIINPVSNKELKIISHPYPSGNLEIFDLQGKSMLKTDILNNVVDVSILKSGLYLAKFSFEDKTITKKIIIK